MKNILKYLLVFIYVSFFMYVLFVQFISNEIVVYMISSVIALLFLFLTSSHLIKQPFSRLLLVATFFFLISVPLVGPKETESFEKRELAEFPKFRFSNVWKFFYGYTTYFNDHFAFRNDAVQLISKVRLHLFHISTMPHLVELGKDNWLYTTREEYVRDLSTPFTKEQLDTVEMNLEIITKYFDLRNIKFYFAMIPVKERIYPEYMSELLKHKMQFSKQSQINERIRSNSKIRSIDVKDTLIEGKKLHPTYYTTDTHWNQYGCFLAYTKIINRIKLDYPELVPSKMSDYDISKSVTDAGDLQLMMGFRDEFQFEHFNFRHKSGIEPLIIDSLNQGPKSWRYGIREMPSVKNKLKIVIVRDSFTEYLRMFMCRDFRRTELIWTPIIPVAKIVEVKPDIVLQEMLELFVMNTIALPPEIAGDTLFLNKYYPGYLK